MAEEQYLTRSLRPLVILFSPLAHKIHIFSLPCNILYLFHLWNIAKIRMYLTFESTKTLVHAYVTCRLDNCNSLLLGSPKYMIQKFQRVQNCAARLVAGQPRAAHIRPVLKELHLLAVEQRITFKLLLLTFKARNNLVPPYLSQLIVPYNPTRNRRSAAKHLL